MSSTGFDDIDKLSTYLQVCMFVPADLSPFTEDVMTDDPDCEEDSSDGRSLREESPERSSTKTTPRHRDGTAKLRSFVVKRKRSCSPSRRRSRSRSPLPHSNNSYSAKMPRLGPHRSHQRPPTPFSDGRRQVRFSRQVREGTPRYPHKPPYDRRSSSSAYRRSYPPMSGGRNFLPQSLLYRRDVPRSMARLRISRELMKSNRDPYHHPQIIPETIEFFVEKPNCATLEAEFFSDGFIQRMADRAIAAIDVSSKIVDYCLLREKFKELDKFCNASKNFDQLVCMRTESIGNSGLICLTAFLEEAMTWMKLSRDLGTGRSVQCDDLIMSTASALCKQALYKLRDMLPCYCPNPSVQNLLKQVSYLIITSMRVEEAAEILSHIYIQDKILYLAAIAITVGMAARDGNQWSPTYKFMSAYITNYQPGTLMGLLSSIVNEHSVQCQDKQCKANSRALLGSYCTTKGLLFIPTK